MQRALNYLFRSMQELMISLHLACDEQDAQITISVMRGTCTRIVRLNESPLKSSLQIPKSDDLELCTWHWRLKFYKIYINDDVV